MIKYTPEHMHCVATFWGPLMPPNTGFVCFQQLKGSQASFRISATGVLREADQTVKVVKKLKLVGTPYKVYKVSGQGWGWGWGPRVSTRRLLLATRRRVLTASKPTAVSLKPLSLNTHTPLVNSSTHQRSGSCSLLPQTPAHHHRRL